MTSLLDVEKEKQERAFFVDADLKQNWQGEIDKVDMQEKSSEGVIEVIDIDGEESSKEGVIHSDHPVAMRSHCKEEAMAQVKR